MKIAQAQEAGDKRANEIELNALKERNEQLELLLDNSPVGLFIANPMGNGLVYSNGGISKILGITTEDLKIENVAARVHPDDQPRLLKAQNAMHSGEKDGFSEKLRVFNKEKKIVWIKLSLNAIRDASGKVISEVGIAEDITEEKALNDRINLSETLLSNLIADAPIGILMINEFGKVTLANKKLCEIFNLDATPKQLVGSVGSTLAERCKWSAKDPDRFIQKVKLLHQRKSLILREEIEFADGRVFERNCMPLSDRDEYKGLLVSYTNITAVRDFEHKLREQKKKYATVIENMDLGWTETDGEGKITAANKRFCELTEYTLKELIGKDGGELLLADTSKENRDFYANRERKVYESHGVRIKTKNGKIKHVLVSAIRTQNSNGEIDGSIGIVFDVTHQKKLELQKEKLLEELESQNDQLNDYAHVVSHDLKSPLRSISTLISWTKEDFSEKLGETGLKNLDLIEEKVEKMDQLIENILRYSSLDREQLHHVNVDLNVVVNDVLEMIFIPETVQIQVVKELPIIVADAGRMQQLFQNLIGNAVNHVDEQEGQITIDFSDSDTHYRFSVKDNGTGIEKEYHDKIFKVFRSFDDNDMSTGIGLSIVKKIITQYEGEIWLESEVGMGTTFFFTLKKQP